MTKREWALHLASQGFSIFKVVHNTKVPESGYSWKNHMTTDADRINAWFDNDPDVNYGVCPNGIGVVIDLDIKGERDGRKFLDTLEQDRPTSECIFGRTFTVQTPSGGLHLYLLIPTEVGNANSFDSDETAIDVRGWGGYVVGPGCEIGENSIGKHYENHGIYEALNSTDNLIECPKWIEDGYLKKPGERSINVDIPLMEMDMPVNVAKANDTLQNHPPAVQGQNGDDLTYNLAAELRDNGVSATKAVELMFSSGWNTRCDPPWDYDDLESTVENAYRYAQNRPGSKADFLGMAFEDGMYDQMMTDIAAEEHRSRGEGESSATGRLFLDYDWVKRGKRREYVIPGWLPTHGFTALNARRGTGKSTIFLDLALRIANDLDWFDIQITPGYKAVYLCGEDDEGLELNTVGWYEHYGLEPNGRTIFADGTPDLMSADDVKDWYEEIQSFVGDDRAVVFLDTWQRASSRAGQNKDEDMQLCVHHAEVLAESLGGPLLGAFHPPKHNEHTILGHSVLENSTSAIWQATEVAEGIKLEVTRIKGHGVGNYGLYHFHKVELDELDAFGHHRSAIVPKKVGGTAEDGTDGGKDDFKTARMLLAKMIRGWIESNEALGSGDPNRISAGSFNNSNISEQVERLQMDPTFRSKYLEPMTTSTPVICRGFSSANITKLLTQYFTNDYREKNKTHPVDLVKATVLDFPECLPDGFTVGWKIVNGKKVYVLDNSI